MFKVLFLIFISNLVTLAASDKNISISIVNGDKVEFGNMLFKSVVSLQSGWKLQHYCGGAIISYKHVITAGHCVKDGLPEIIYGGSYNWKNPEFVLKPIKLYKHPDYSGTTNDIAIIEFVPNSLVGPEHIASIDFNQDYNYVTSKLTAVGWGYTYEYSGICVDELRQVDLQIIDNNQCNKMYFGSIDDTNICTLGEWNNNNNNRGDACQCDSGTPMFVKNKNIITCLVSRGRGCGRKNYAGVNTNIGYYSDFIKNIIGGSSYIKPTQYPSTTPTSFPTRPLPTQYPSRSPTQFPTRYPSRSPTQFPTRPLPTQFPTRYN